MTKIPQQQLELNDLFWPVTKRFHARWKGTKPEIQEAEFITYLVSYSVLYDDRPANDLIAHLFATFSHATKKASKFPSGFPKTAGEIVLMLLVTHTDFCAGLIKELRKPQNLKKFNRPAKIIMRASARGELDDIPAHKIQELVRGNRPPIKGLSDRAMSMLRLRLKDRRKQRVTTLSQ